MRYSRPVTVPRKWSSAWWTPSALLAAVQLSNKPISSRRLFNDPSQAMRSRREAYVAALFATILEQNGKCRELRMEEGQFPDFHLRTSEHDDIPFEITEADRIGRQRGLEYRRKPRVKSYDAVEEEAEAQRVVPMRVARKAAKRYAPIPHLLVYVNLSTFARRPETDADLARSIQPWRSNFGAIWALWGPNAIQLSPKLEKFSAQQNPLP
jgi:hypothetical protein